MKETVSTPDTPHAMTIVETEESTSCDSVDGEVVLITKALLECIRLRDFDGYKYVVVT